MEVRLPAHKQDSYTKVQMLLVNKGDGKYTSFALRAFDLHNSLFNQLYRSPMFLVITYICVT